jgi:hypothetical protein
MVIRSFFGSLPTAHGATWVLRQSEKRFADEANRVAREGGSNKEIRQAALEHDDTSSAANACAVYLIVESYTRCAKASALQSLQAVAIEQQHAWSGSAARRRAIDLRNGESV